MQRMIDRLRQSGGKAAGEERRNNVRSVTCNTSFMCKQLCKHLEKPHHRRARTAAPPRRPPRLLRRVALRPWGGGDRDGDGDDDADDDEEEEDVGRDVRRTATPRSYASYEAGGDHEPAGGPWYVYAAGSR